MVYLKKILVTTDLSGYSLAAIEYASSFGLLYTSKLFLLHVVEPGKQEEEAKSALKTFVEENISSDIRLIPVVMSGSPAEEIKRFAEREGIDLIVMATHGRTGLRHVLMGSVAEKAVRLSAVPVLTVKPKQIREDALRDEDIERELHLR